MAHEVGAILCLAAAATILLAQVTYVPDEPATNQVGAVGFGLASFLARSLGYAGYLFPLLLGAAGVAMFADREIRITPVRGIGGFFFILLSAVSLGLGRPYERVETAGGWIGGFVANELTRALGRGGSSVVLLALFMLVFMMLTGGTITEFFSGIAAAFTEMVEAVRNGFQSTWKRLQALVSNFPAHFSGLSAVTERLRGGLALPGAVAARLGRGPSAGADEEGPEIGLPGRKKPGAKKPKARRPGAGRGAAAEDVGDEADGPPAPARKRARMAEPEADEAGGKVLIDLSGVQRDERPASRLSRRAAKQQQFPFDENYRLPPPNLLGPNDDRTDYVDERTLIDQSKVLEQKLATFGVNGRVTAVRPGPVITTYELEPEVGVRVSRVVNLSDDLTMALRAHSVRIVAPIPGKNVVGIEVANRKRAIVGLRDLIDSDDYRKEDGKLTIALGRDTMGTPTYGNLAKMPHLLMAGATGTGKSVALNAYIISILCKATPTDVRFIMIDPKMLELSLYEGIPHLLVPVVTDVKKAAAALSNVMREMDRRFEIMKEKRVRNLQDYNKRVRKEMAEAERSGVRPEPAAPGEPEPVVHEPMPQIVVIVDELADLMMVVGREIEQSITRLAQKARAAGIHLILATQRPSVDVITGLIKANFPARISFKVSSRPDSRTILDTVGSERLLGNGDLLYLAPGTSNLARLHGGYIGDEEIDSVVDFWKDQGEPEYQMDLLDTPGSADGDDEDAEFFDELYDKAVDLVTQHGQASTSWLQRKLGIGYNRSARIMEHMEREGVVGPADGAKPRKVIAQAIQG